MNKPSFISWRPKTTAILLSGLAALLIYSVALYAATNFKPTTDFRAGSGVFSLEVADTEARRAQGLSGVESLKSNGGLLIKFDTDDTWGIWMKDMKIPIDILWINSEKKIVYIVKNAAPELSTDTVFYPKTDARFVVELPAGSVDTSGIKTGTLAQFDENAKGGW